MEALLVVAVLCAVAWFVTVPLRSRHAAERVDVEDPERAELQARKEAKYRQIRDAELDREQGKLSQGDWARANAELRGEAMAILRELDDLDARGRAAGDDS